MIYLRVNPSLRSEIEQMCKEHNADRELDRPMSLAHFAEMLLVEAVTARQSK